MADNTNNDESILNASVSDQDSEDDYLGFEPYVVAIAEFLTNPSTKPPLNLSIEGEWGSGKSSFMKQLRKAIIQAERKRFDQKINQAQQELKAYFQKFRHKNIQNKILSLSSLIRNSLKWINLELELITYRPPTTVWFNAWRHDKAEALWAAFALEFLRQIYHFWGNIKLRFLRFHLIQSIEYIFYGMIGLLFLIALIVIALKNGDILLQRGANFIAELLFQKQFKIPVFIVRFITFGSAFIAFVRIILTIININKATNDLNKYLKSPKYENQIEFIEEFHADFTKIVEAFAGQNKVYVFIDDLDRCEVPKSAELMQAINMMIANDPQLIFILGMDREKVAAGIAVRHQELIPYLEVDANNKVNSNYYQKGIDYGYKFLEKFIQLPFQIPKPSENDIANLLQKNSSLNQPRNPQKNNCWSKVAQQVFKILPTWNSSGKRTISKNGQEAELRQEQNSYSEKLVRRKEFKLGFTQDSNRVREIALMVAPMLDYNPRRIKQFINLFRLKAFIALNTGLFDELFDGSSDELTNQPLTLEQLGKFTAITLKFPQLLLDLDADHLLLKKLQMFVNHDSPNPDHYDSTTKYWISNKKLVELLRHSQFYRPGVSPKRYMMTDEYSFEKIAVDKLLQVSPQVIRSAEADNFVPKQEIDYTKLNDLLKAGNWEDADYETYLVMLKAVGRKNGDYLRDEELLNFPCTDLRTIDQLWVKYSNGRFGFSVQKGIYLSIGGIADGVFQVLSWKKFGKIVGWLNVDGDYFLDGSDGEEYTFDISAPSGHLPVLDRTLQGKIIILFPRIETCMQPQTTKNPLEFLNSHLGSESIISDEAVEIINSHPDIQSPTSDK